MKKAASTLAVILVSVWAATAAFAQGANYKDYTITGPYTHKNLSVFLVHGKDSFDGKDFMTLEEGLKNKQFVIYETGDVNELMVENKSRTEKVFIQAGDIIKGGRQDRVIQKDIILKPLSGKTDISVFCVESDRWVGRGQENSRVFGSSTAQLPSKDLKLAVNGKLADSAGHANTYAAAPQEQVWNQVGVAQQKLSTTLGADVKSKQSESSLELTLENKNLQKLSKEYLDDINSQIKGNTDVVGYVFSINGEINSGDIYGNSALFSKLWHKLVQSCSTEAISDMNQGKNSKQLQPGDITKWLAGADKVKAHKKTIDGNNVALEEDSPAYFGYESYEADKPAMMIHKNIINK
jgi:hypothetical protein